MTRPPDHAVTGEPTPGDHARPITIAVDAMGGDHAPAAIVEGAVAAADAFGIDVILTGRSAQLAPLLTAQDGASSRNGAASAAHRGQVRIVTAEDSLAMDEGALASLRRPRSTAACARPLRTSWQAMAALDRGRRKLARAPSSMARESSAVTIRTCPRRAGLAAPFRELARS